MFDRQFINRLCQLVIKRQYLLSRFFFKLFWIQKIKCNTISCFRQHWWCHRFWGVVVYQEQKIFPQNNISFFPCSIKHNDFTNMTTVSSSTELWSALNELVRTNCFCCHQVIYIVIILLIEEYYSTFLLDWWFGKKADSICRVHLGRLMLLISFLTFLSPNTDYGLKKALFLATAIASLLTAAFWSNNLYHAFWLSSISNISGHICSGFLHKATLLFSKAEWFSHIPAFDNNCIAVISQSRSKASSFPSLSMKIELHKQFPSPQL